MDKNPSWDSTISQIKMYLGGEGTFDSKNADVMLNLVKTDCFAKDSRIRCDFHDPKEIDSNVFTVAMIGVGVMSVDLTLLSQTIKAHGYISSATVGVVSVKDEPAIEIKIGFFKITSNKQRFPIPFNKITILHKCDEKIMPFSIYRLSEADKKLAKSIIDILNNISSENQRLVTWEIAPPSKTSPDTFILIANNVTSIPVLYLNLIIDDIGKRNVVSIKYCFDDTKPISGQTPMFLFECNVQAASRYVSGPADKNRDRDRD